MIVIPLGVASATPTATRHLPAVALWREGSVFLFDCGENAQMSMLQAGIKRSKIECVFISHFDVDHYSGLIGLLSTLQLQRREKPLKLVGPKGLQEYIEWNLNFSNIEIGYEIIFIEVDEKTDEAVVVDEEDYFVVARALKHRKFCLGYRFQEKDKPGKVNAVLADTLGVKKDEDFKALKSGEDIELEDGTIIKSTDIVGHPRPGDSFAYITDTEYCPNAVRLAMNTNILYHEATFDNSLAEKAIETGHSTAKDAARVATESQTKLLVIGHFSARYTNAHVLLNEAREGFYPAWLAQELRPIFTDPAKERGIIQPKVEIRDLTKKRSTRRHDSGDRGKRPVVRNFRSRGESSGRRRKSSYSTGDSDRGSYNRGSDRGGSRPSYRNDDRRWSDRRNESGSQYSKRYKDRNESEPKGNDYNRSSYDDYDRL